MKTLKTSLIVAILFLTSLSSWARPINGISVITARYEIFYGKVVPDWFGGHVQVLDCTHETITEQTLGANKFLIDFFYIPAGTYTIVFTKGDLREEFTYEKK